MNLRTAIDLAFQAHAGQVDKAGHPAIHHALRVMANLRGEEAMMAGVLHDVVEDSGVTLDDLRSVGFSEVVVNAVDAVTRRDGESYEDFIERAGKHPVGRMVKLADLRDNMDLSRLDVVTERDHRRTAKYEAAERKLEG